ncbi:Methyltransferase-like protein 27 [Holothuria leucospilota]|uniref:Methyltransferase-like protein 27 n=1 Tax=Holothuria leucospilota TaxID=206669 RepID=A0A9Q1CCD1_HOLLE|nr:Methyltransferase-like protein 27 [Holothuria leucospilota]
MTESGENEASLHFASGIEEAYHILKNPDNLRKERVRELYERWSLDYDKDVQKVNFYPYIKAGIVIAEHCHDKNVSILDCGAGTGLVGEQLRSLGYTNIVGLDISQNCLNVAEKKGVYKKLICDEVGDQRMPFDDDEFDVLVCSGCIAPAHISPTCFPEWVRIIKPGGRVVIVMRRCYIELLKGEEEYFSQTLKEMFDTSVRDLEESKKWEVVTREVFAGFLEGGGHEKSDGIVLVFKIL